MLRITGLVLLLTVGQSLWAQPNDLGRLFTTAQERQEVDVLSRERLLAEAKESDLSLDSEGQSSTELLRFSGYISVKGKDSIWVNGVSGLKPQENSPKNLVFDGAGKDLYFSKQSLVFGESPSLKPGQAWSYGANKVLQAYEVESTIKEIEAKNALVAKQAALATPTAEEKSNNPLDQFSLDEGLLDGDSSESEIPEFLPEAMKAPLEKVQSAKGVLTDLMKSNP